MELVKLSSKSVFIQNSWEGGYEDNASEPLNQNNELKDAATPDVVPPLRIIQLAIKPNLWSRCRCLAWQIRRNNKLSYVNTWLIKSMLRPVTFSK